MKKVLLFAVCVLLNYASFSQIIYEEFNSTKLGESRRLKIQLPRNYETNVEKKYPIVLVLDADYLFEPVAGNVDYFSYWEDMPESIVVGVMHDGGRYADCHYDENNSLPAERGASFFEFIGMELMPYLDKTYRTARFTIAIGHDFTANFLNYYLFKSPVLFNGFINLSPDFAPNMEDRVAERIPDIQQQIFYYLATGTDDVKRLRESALRLNTALSSIENDRFSFYFDNFEGGNHYSLVARGIPTALEKIFSVYRPISNEEYSQVLMKTEKPLFQYLMDRYAVIESLFGIKNNIRTSDFIAVGKAAESRKQWDALEDLGKLARRQYPNSMLGDYFLARYYEETGNYRRAVQTYRGAYNKEEIDFINVDLMLDSADRVQDQRRK